MVLKSVYEKQEDIPENFRELYSERNGKWELTGVEGVKTQADVDRLQTALNKERADHKTTKDGVAAWTALGETADKVREQLERIPELEAKAGNIDETKIEQIVETRLKIKQAPLQRELEEANRKLGEANTQIATFQQGEQRRTIHDAVRAAAKGSNMHESAVDDAIMLGERDLEIVDDQVVQKGTGLKPDLWLGDLKSKRSHWWPESAGGGAGGGHGQNQVANNPWSKAHWNLTAQGQVVREKGMGEAEKMAKAAGSSIGATKPPTK